MPCYVQW